MKTEAPPNLHHLFIDLLGVTDAAMPASTQQKLVLSLLDSVLVWDRWLTESGARCTPLEAEFHGMTIRYVKGVLKLWRRRLQARP